MFATADTHFLTSENTENVFAVGAPPGRNWVRGGATVLKVEDKFSKRIEQKFLTPISWPVGGTKYCLDC